MDKFSFNFGSVEPNDNEEITPPPTQLEGVIFSFVPTPVSELTQMEKDYQNYLQEWDNIKKLSAAQQLDLLERSSNFIKNVKPGQFNIAKFADKMEQLYNNLDEEVKIKFYKLFKRLVIRRFVGLELGLENKLTSKNPQELEFGIVLLTMFIQTTPHTDLLAILLKYIPIFKNVVDAHVSGAGILQNPLIMYVCLRKMSMATKFVRNDPEVAKGYKGIYDNVIGTIIPLKNYPSKENEQKLWWQIRSNIFRGLPFYNAARKIPIPITNNIIEFFDYITEQKIAIPTEDQNHVLGALCNLTQYSKVILKKCLSYWDWIILPGLKPSAEEMSNIDQTEQAVEKIRKDQDIFAELNAMGIVSNLLAHTSRAPIVDRVLQDLASEDVLVKCAGLKVLLEIFVRADYARDHVDKIIKEFLIPSLDHSHVVVRAYACHALSTLNSKSKSHLKPIMSSLMDKLFDLLAHDKFYVKYYAIKALNQFALKLSGAHLIESKILEGHMREIAAVNNLVPLHNIGALLTTDVFVNHAPMFLKDTLRRACDLIAKEGAEDNAIEASDYFLFAKDIFLNDRVVASQATLQAIEPIMVQFLEHPIFRLANMDNLIHVVGDCLDVLAFATFHIPLITKEFWDAFRVMFYLFQNIEVDQCEEFLVPIGNYVARAPEHFLQIPNGVNIVLEKINNMNFTEELTGWEFVVELLSNLGKAEPKIVSGVLDIVVKILDERPRQRVLLHLFRAVWTAMYVDPRLTLQKLDAKHPNWWKKWESVRTKADTAFGHVGKKILALGMISLISLNLVVDVPKPVVSQTDGFAAIFRQLVQILAALQDFDSVDYIAPISKMAVQSEESEALRAEAKRRAPIKDDDIVVEFDDSDEDDVIDFDGDQGEPLHQFEEVHEQLEIMEDDDNMQDEINNLLGGDDDGDDEDGVEEIEDQNESNMLKVDHLMMLFNARKNDPNTFDTILGALDEEERMAIEEHLKRVKIGPKSLLDQAIEFVGRHYERYETDPNMKRLNADVIERINKWLVTPQPLPEK